MANEWVRPDFTDDEGGTAWTNDDNVWDADANTYANVVLATLNGRADPDGVLEAWYGSGPAGPANAESKLISKVHVKITSGACGCAAGSITWLVRAYYDARWNLVAGGSGLAAINIDNEYEIEAAGKDVLGFRLTVSTGCFGFEPPGPWCNSFVEFKWYDVKGWELSAAKTPVTLLQDSVVL